MYRRFHCVGMSRGEGYLLDNQQWEAGERHVLLGRIFDPWTLARLERLGLGPGMTIWEAGAGSLGLAGELARRVGPTGLVMATDVDTRWMAAQDRPVGVEVRHHDLVRDTPPTGPWDFVHARLVLLHLPERERVLQALVGAVRPGGWILLEEADPRLQPMACPDDDNAAQRLANTVRNKFRTLLEGRAADLAFGRRLAGLMRAAGLHDVGADAYFPLVSEDANALEAATVRQTMRSLLEGGLLTAEELEQHLENLAAGAVDVTTAPLVSCWGRKATSPDVATKVRQP